MRVAAAVLALLTGVLSASAQDAVRTPRPKPAPAAAPASAKPATPAVKPAVAKRMSAAAAKLAAAKKPGDRYAGIPLPERIAMQADLIWTGDYNGLADGDFSARTVAAIKAYQKKFKSKETGILNPQERAALAASAKERREAVGWRMADDPAGGGRVGLPGKLLPQNARAGSGSRWSSVHGETVVETFRVPGTLAEAFAQQRKEPADRRIEYNVMKDDFFVISGLQGLKKFYQRAQFKDGEVRGLTVLYDQAVEGTMEKIVVAMSSAFAPFASAATAPLVAPLAKRNVDYSTGIEVSATGDNIADRRMTEGCHVITVARLGNAERVAEDQANNLALLRVYGARDLRPLALAGDAAAGPDLTLVGIADPQAQSGGGSVSVARARLGGTRALEPAPAPGFSGAAAIDGQGRFAGTVELKPQLVAGAGSGNLPPAAMAVSVEGIRTFLEAQNVRLVAGRATLDDAKASVVRVICVRK